jgi:hypothetical protein
MEFHHSDNLLVKVSYFTDTKTHPVLALCHVTKKMLQRILEAMRVFAGINMVSKQGCWVAFPRKGVKRGKKKDPLIRKEEGKRDAHLPHR